jgi:hypothetical protein
MKYLTLITILFLTRLAFGQGGTREVVICNGSSVRIKAESASSIGFEWRRNGQTIPGVSGNELVVNEEGNYSVFALNADGCISDQSVLVILEFRRPVAVDDFFSGKSNITLLLDVMKNDQPVCTPLDATTLTIKTLPANGILKKENEQYIYTPNTDFKGQDFFTYSVKDNSGQESNTARVTVDLSTPLPVTLAAFNAVRQEAVALLTWSTTSEINSELFEIQRSTDAKNWTLIRTVRASGNAANTQYYRHTDELPESGTNYYRLKMIDFDQSFAFSQIRSVHFPEFSWARLFPNPVSHTLQINIRNKMVRKLRLIDLSGRVLHDIKIQSSELQLDMRPYIPGMYFVHLEQENGLVAVFKITRD